MRRCAAIILIAIYFAGLCQAACADGDWPRGADWDSLDPQAAGFDAAALNAALVDALRLNTKGLLVLRSGRVVTELYAADWDRDQSHNIFSATKSVTAILVGIALDEGKFKGLDQPIADFAGQLKGTPKEGILLRHLLSMTSGLDNRGFPLDTTEGDQFEINLRMPLKAAPGTRWEYNTQAYHLHFRLLEKATGVPLEEYSRTKLFGPLGMEHTAWEKRQVGEVTNYYRLRCSTRDMGRFGLFALRGGEWDGKQLVSREFLRLATTPSQNLNRNYGFLWTLNTPEESAEGNGQRASTAPAPQTGFRFSGSPNDTIAALGAFGQCIMIVPSLDLVVVRTGDSPGPAKGEAVSSDLLRRIVEAILPAKE
ncbi:MAG: serine hydrolase domain-containing protein [Planctomycetaceae bacterium]